MHNYDKNLHIMHENTPKIRINKKYLKSHTEVYIIDK